MPRRLVQTPLRAFVTMLIIVFATQAIAFRVWDSNRDADLRKIERVTEENRERLVENRALARTFAEDQVTRCELTNAGRARSAAVLRDLAALSATPEFAAALRDLAAQQEQTIPCPTVAELLAEARGAPSSGG